MSTDADFIKNLSVKLNVPVDKLQQQFEEAKEEMRCHFPNQSEEIIIQKAKLKLKVDHKRKFLSSAIPFVGIIIASDAIRDPIANIRNKQIERYIKAKESSEKNGDASIMQEVFDNGIVRLDENTQKIIPLWPKLKTNGEPNKLAGKDLPPTEESQMQTIYGIGMAVGSEEAKAFTLELRGDACNAPLHVGKIVNFRAINRTPEGSNILELSTNNTEFIPGDNEKLQEGINKMGITGLLSHFYKDRIASWDEVKQWITEKLENPSAEPIPKKYTDFNKFMILPESLCVYQNFTPDQKDRIKINVCNTADEFDDLTVLCLAPKSLDESIDFAHNSKVAVVGRPWIPDIDENGQTRLIIMTSGMFAYNGWKVPRVETQEINQEQLNQKPKTEKPAPKPAQTPRKEMDMDDIESDEDEVF